MSIFQIILNHSEQSTQGLLKMQFYSNSGTFIFKLPGTTKSLNNKFVHYIKIFKLPITTANLYEN